MKPFRLSSEKKQDKNEARNIYTEDEKENEKSDGKKQDDAKMKHKTQ